MFCTLIVPARPATVREAIALISGQDAFPISGVEMLMPCLGQPTDLPADVISFATRKALTLDRANLSVGFSRGEESVTLQQTPEGPMLHVLANTTSKLYDGMLEYFVNHGIVLSVQIGENSHAGKSVHQLRKLVVDAAAA